VTPVRPGTRRPAWSEAFGRERRSLLSRRGPIAVDRATVFGDSDGRGVTVAIVDSGIERDHPAVGGRVVRGVRVVLDGARPRVVDDDDRTDPVGHGTACAGIIHALAPAAELVSVRVLGPDNKAPGILFAAAIEWLVAESVPVANLSLSSRKEALFAAFHDLADAAYFGNTLLVCAANNLPGPSYPSLFASVVSVAAHDIPDPWTWFYNAEPPVEFGAWGVDVPVAWNRGGRIVATGNSLAAPHIAGLAALVRQTHARATPFEVKALLAATASSALAGPAD
jgi:subtilisin family serine protease